MRRVIAALVLAAAATPASHAAATGGTYEAVFCDPVNRSYGGEIQETSAFAARSRCSDGANDFAFKIESAAAADEGRGATVFWEVEAPLQIVGVEVDARLKRANGYRAELHVGDRLKQPAVTFAQGKYMSGPAPWKTYSWSGKPQSIFSASLTCGTEDGCPQSPDAKTWVRNLTLTISDLVEPELEVEGSLFERGWIRGAADLGFEARDLESGVALLSASINGEPGITAETACRSLGAIALTLATPCESDAVVRENLGTNSAPFHNGSNSIEVCTDDFARNESCDARTVLVDNLAPSLSFSSQQDSEDPELIRARVMDEHSGLDQGLIFFRAVGSTVWRPVTTQQVAGELQARVNSAAEPPGTYEFMAAAEDIAGNESETTLRQDGSTMTLEFPLRSGVDLDARLAPGGSQHLVLTYGKSSKAAGRLTDAAGVPMPNQPIVVDEYFGEGALIDHRTRTVLTDEDGIWSSKLPAGPSRSITASFAGDQRYLGDQQHAGRVTVETGARLSLARSKVKEGRAAIFKGRVGRLGAMMPTRGKVLQLQYQDPDSKRWFTVRNPFNSRINGTFRFEYEFGTHYVQDVAIKFRLKVPPEENWPYRATRTAARRVIVQAR